jgi:AcrR family transcriptional regulator
MARRFDIVGTGGQDVSVPRAALAERSQKKSQKSPDRSTDRRASILGAALARFGQYGYRRTALEDVAREAGISRAALYLHFRNKEDLFRALSSRLQDGALAAADAAAAAGGTVEERLRRVLEAKFGHFYDLAHRSAHARELLDENDRICGDISAAARKRYLRILDRVLAQAVDRGELRPARAGLAPAAAAELIADCARGLEHARGDALTPAVYRRRLAQLVRVLIAGLR